VAEVNPVPNDWKSKIANFLSFTTLGLATASIALSLDGSYQLAGVLILAGYLIDGIDGQVARRFGGSDFGTQLDSLVDLTLFGVATALLISQHVAIGPSNSWLLWLLLAGYLMAGSFRLARFNLAIGSLDKETTTGLTISTGGAYLTLAVLADIGLGELYFADWLYIPLLLSISLLMISRIRFPDFKGLVHYRSPVLATFAAGAVAAIWLPFELALLGVWTVYVLFGTLRAAIRVFA
jgi:CDP-diacylglycerol--serine O-phosphatidyltransferase